MKKTIQIIVLAVLCLFGSKASSAQNGGLRPGDVIPDVSIPNVVNSTKEIVQLADYKDKLLILAFWDPSCKSVRQSMHQMNNIQASHRMNLQILAVTTRDKGAVQTALSRDKTLGAAGIPIVAEDKVLNSLLPNEILPHLVWILDGKVIAITDIQYLNSDNISAANSRKGNTWPVKTDRLNYDYSRSHFIRQSTKFPGKRVYYSCLSPYVPGVQSRLGREADSLNQTIRTWIVNAPIHKIYLMAFSRYISLPENQIIWEVRDKSRFVYEEKLGYEADWNPKYLFSYESIMPLHTSLAQRATRVQNDLNNAFNLNGRMETRLVDILVLDYNPDKLMPSRSVQHLNTLHRSDTAKILRKASLSSIVWEMNMHSGNPPVRFTKKQNLKVDIDLPVSSMTDLAGIKKALEPYGIYLKSEKREIEFFVLTENTPQVTQSN